MPGTSSSTQSTPPVRQQDLLSTPMVSAAQAALVMGVYLKCGGSS